MRELVISLTCPNLIDNAIMSQDVFYILHKFVVHEMYSCSPHVPVQINIGVNFPTRLQNTLDLVLMPYPSFKIGCKPLPPIGLKSDHDMVLPVNPSFII